MGFFDYNVKDFFTITDDNESPVVSFSLSDDKKSMMVMEECDNYYEARLNKEEIFIFIEKLKDILNLMEK